MLFSNLLFQQIVLFWLSRLTMLKSVLNFSFFVPMFCHQCIENHFRNNCSPPLFFKILFIYSWETLRERGRDIGRGRRKLTSRSPMQDLIPALQDHALGRRQVPNLWATQMSPFHHFLAKSSLLPPKPKLFLPYSWIASVSKLIAPLSLIWPPCHC